MKFDEEKEAFSIPVGLKWTFIRLKDKVMEIKITFEEPGSVSITSKFDKVFVRFKNEIIFMTEKDLINIEPDYEISGEIP
jgi:hypothetical protein